MSAQLQLDQPLPAEVLRRTSAGLAEYRNYPVFSWPWLRKRTTLVGLGVGAFAGLLGFVVWVTQHEAPRALWVFSHFTLGALVITTAGPFLATVVRQRRLAPVLERRLVVGAVVVGALLSSGVDSAVSAALDADLGSALGGSPALHPSEHPAVLFSNLVLAFIIYGLFGGGLAVGRYFNEERRLTELTQERAMAELEARQRELDVRLGLLQAQVEPHFLFNTLASVRSLVTSDPALAQATIDALVDYLRATIPRLRGDAAEVVSTLGQQVELCERYLALMGARMGGRLEVHVDVDATLRSASFPPLLLIILVENAIKHGLEPKPGPGRVAIRASAKPPGRLQVSVVDDGVGLREGFGAGVGLSNLRAWLQARFGAEASFSLTGAPGQGAEATVAIPLEGGTPSTR